MLVGALIALVLASGVLQVWASYQQAFQHGERDALNWARAIDENTRRTFSSVGRLLHIIAAILPDDQGPGGLDHPAIGQLTEDLQNAAPHIMMVAVTDPGGAVVVHSGSYSPAGTAITELPWLREFRAADTDGILRVGRPMRDRSTGQWGVPVGLRVNGADGSFRGVVIAVFNGSFIGEFYRSIDVGDDGRIALLRRDGVVLFANHDQEIGHDTSHRRLFREHLPNAPEGIYDGESESGVARVTAYREVAGLPLVVRIDLSHRDILAEWFAAMLAEIMLALGAIPVIGGLAWLLARQFRRVRASERRFRLLAENATDVIWLHDLDGICRYVSPSCQRVTGHRPDELIGKPMEQSLVPADREAFQQFLRSLRHGTASASGSFRVAREDGTLIWLEMSSGHVRESTMGTGGEIVGVSRDVSDRVRFTQQLQEQRQRVEEQAAYLVTAARELEAARIEAESARRTAEQASIAKSQFLASMSHELRTPLNAILGFSEMLHEQMFGPLGDARYRDYAGDIHDSGLHLLQLINDILDIAKIEAGKMQLCLTRIDLNHLFHGVLRLVKVKAQNRGIALSCQAPADLPPLRADERAVKQILFNLLSNAVKFTSRGGTITLAATAQDDYLSISVADTGAGIPAEEIDRVFRPFEQIDNKYGVARDGTGLGLPLVHALVELHHGSVAIASTVGVGTTMTVRLPLDPTVAANENESLAPRGEGTVPVPPPVRWGEPVTARQA